MAERTVGFVGGGRVVRILLGGWQRAEAVPATVAVYDPDPSVLERTKELWPRLEASATSADVASKQDVVFLAVHPPAMRDAAETVREKLRPDAIVVSLAPKFSISTLREMLAGFDRLARVIPNAPSIIGRGYNPVSYSAALGETDRHTVQRLFQPLGQSPVVDEPTLEAYAVCVAMGPTYFWPPMRALLELARSFGLSDGEARTSLQAMLVGAAELLWASDLAPSAVEDLIPV
ncbi:MAG TPA: pyrroline-5-carboxylate reductase, partial [Planctomycetaceae bacterium]|nr:pyrroline-5-carboxylate reductase [Planctomycetaceae bacterium]